MTWGAVIGAGVSLVGGALLGNGGGGGGGGGSSSSTTAYDPYAPYRGAAAQQLQQLMKNPSSIQQLPEYNADLQAAARTMAAQGYTGSGNALVAAANAGGQAYQQAFNNLALLSGAGQSPAAAQGAANQQADYLQQQQNLMWGQIGNTVGNIVNNSGWGSGGSTAAPGGGYSSFGSGGVAIGNSYVGA